MLARRVLQGSAALELLTLTVLVGNVVLAHDPGVASAVGPVHGLAYVTTIGSALLLDGAPRAARWLTLVPGVGGMLADRVLRRHETPDAGVAPAPPVARSRPGGRPWT